MTQDDITPRSSPSLPTRDEIASAAADVRHASAELDAGVHAIEQYLEVRNICVSVWVQVKGWEAPSGEFWKRELGYDRFGHSWHIGIRESRGHEGYPELESTETWTFANSPRKSRISASDKIPDLLRELIKESGRTARRLREKASEVNAFAASLNLRIKPTKAKE